MKCIEHLACLGHCSKCFPCTSGIGTIGLRQLLELKKFLCGQVGCGLRLFDYTSHGINYGIVSSDYARICLFRPPFEIVRYFPCLHCDDVFSAEVFDGLFRLDPWKYCFTVRVWAHCKGYHTPLSDFPGIWMN